MRTASYVGFFAMLAVGFGAFAWVDAWWARALLLVTALAIGWYSLGLFARASQGAAWRAIRAVATAEDINELEHLGDRARAESFNRAASAPDPQRDRIFGEFVDMWGGLYGARRVVTEHLGNHGVVVNDAEARRILNAWRVHGIIKDQSLGDFLDGIAEGYWEEVADEDDAEAAKLAKFGLKPPTD